MPPEEKRHGRSKWPEVRVVYRGSLKAFVERPKQDSTLRIRRNRKMLQDVVKNALRTISRQVGEDNDDDLVHAVVAVNGLNIQEQALVTVHELDNTRRASVGDMLRSGQEGI